MAKRVGVILSGCGVYDGAEIHESVIMLLALDRAGAEVVICAPDVEQMHVINHHTGEVAEGESRNVRIEAARIARGPVADVAEIDADDLDALILPGGFGAAKNLSTFAVAGADSRSIRMLLPWCARFTPRASRSQRSASLRRCSPRCSGPKGETDHRQRCRHRRRHGGHGCDARHLPGDRVRDRS